MDAPGLARNRGSWPGWDFQEAQALCQKRLVPYSQFYHWVKERMAVDMRRALLLQLAGDADSVLDVGH